MSLIKDYEKYVFHININNAKQLLESIWYYDYANYENDIEIIKQIHRKKTKQSFDIDAYEFRSNGSSSGRYTIYPFKPHYNFWHENLNSKIRNPYQFKNLQNYKIYHANHDANYFKIIQTKDQFQNDTTCLLLNYHSYSCQENIYKYLSKLEDDSLQIYGQPYEYLPFLTDHELCKLFFKKTKLVASSCDWAFLPRKNLGYFNDHMLSWKSGIFFYTCSHKEKHFLPLCYKHNGKNYNILNLTNPFVYDESDLFEYHGRVECNCGKLRPIIKFIGHEKNMITNKNGDFISDQIAEGLQGKYTWLQLFLRKDQILEIFFSKNSEIDKDLQYLYDAIQPVEIILRKNQNMHVGLNKYPLVWSHNSYRSHKFKYYDIQLF